MKAIAVKIVHTTGDEELLYFNWHNYKGKVILSGNSCAVFDSVQTVDEQIGSVEVEMNRRVRQRRIRSFTVQELNIG